MAIQPQSLSLISRCFAPTLPRACAVNLFFVAFIQNFLLLAAELPQYLLLTLGSSFKAHTGYTAPPLGVADWVLAGIFVSILCIEMIADNQQQRYQHFKVDEKPCRPEHSR